MRTTHQLSVVEEFFNGSLRAHGIVKDRGGKVTRYFNASINAYWVDGVGTLDEVFIFDDGGEQRRIWKLVKDDAGNYVGSANDVVGNSTLKIAGNSLFLVYLSIFQLRNESEGWHPIKPVSYPVQRSD
jgi:hypothetical protein